MAKALRIGIIGDFDRSKHSHPATNAALHHAAEALDLPVDVRWLATPLLVDSAGLQQLAECDGLWAAPGSPYESKDGALAGIRFARERDWPFVGT